jgi:hypothetical protein
MKLEEAKAKLVGKIKGYDKVYDDYEAYCEELRNYFQAGQFKKMAKLLGKYTVLATPEGKRLRGKCSLAKFWRSAKKKEGPGTHDIDFEEKCVYIRPIAKENQIAKKDPDKTIVHAAHLIIEFHIISKTPGETARNSTGSYAQTLPHPNGCQWEP